MKYALLIAWREFAESIKAKGFWIGIFTMPVILFLTIQYRCGYRRKQRRFGTSF